MKRSKCVGLSLFVAVLLTPAAPAATVGLWDAVMQSDAVQSMGRKMQREKYNALTKVEIVNSFRCLSCYEFEFTFQKGQGADAEELKRSVMTRFDAVVGRLKVEEKDPREGQ